MSTRDSESAALQSAVRVIWQECGHTPPEGAELLRAATNLCHALRAGQQIPRVADKTQSPMVGPRLDIEHCAITGES